MSFNSRLFHRCTTRPESVRKPPSSAELACIIKILICALVLRRERERRVESRTSSTLIKKIPVKSFYWRHCLPRSLHVEPHSAYILRPFSLLFASHARNEEKKFSISLCRSASEWETQLCCFFFHSGNGNYSWRERSEGGKSDNWQSWVDM